ncbi:MAG TPA: MAPEG family protein [Caulobacteraceae bacterium]|jgi:uncharacterized MAPEG superfamily protein
MYGITELQLLGLAVVIGLVQILWTAVAVTKQTGLQYNAGPRDEPFVATGKAARLQRAQANFLETFPFFAAAVLGGVMQGYAGGLLWWGALIYVVARALYVPLYVWGVTGLRSLVWLASLVGIAMTLVCLFC